MSEELTSVYTYLMEHYKCSITEHLILNQIPVFCNMFIYSDVTNIHVCGTTPDNAWCQWEYEIYNDNTFESKMEEFSSLLKTFLALMATGDAVAPMSTHFL